MCNSLLLQMIKQFKKENMEVFDVIYAEFEKLINFYAFRGGGEDMRSELTLFLIELLYAIDLSNFKDDHSNGLKKYIAVSLRNRYIVVSKKQQKELKSQNILYDNIVATCETSDDKILTRQMLNFLTQKQKTVLIYKYVLGYSDIEIAEIFNTERQAVNQIKRRALKVLRMKIQEELCLD